MPMSTNVVVALFALLLCVPAAQAQQQKAREGIEATNKELVDALAHGDAAGVAATYTSDAQMFPANSDAVSGRTAIQNLWGEWIKAGIKRLTLQPTEVEAFGDTAYEVGKCTMPGDDGKLLDEGKYIVIWKRQQEKWRLHRDIWTTSVPAAAQK
ncbi:MAG TPA: SgcJ/EcaC family oxidoreductase [Burkholderiales bacterium]|nr:SgcJ/EcaC family oxidoreductase [Burkholderiales bacterium]